MSLLEYPSQETYDHLNRSINDLTAQPTLCEAFKVVGAVGHARGCQVDLNTAFQKITALPDSQETNSDAKDVDQVEVYADHLTASTPVRLPINCVLLTLIARVAFVEPKPVVVELPDGFDQVVIELHCARSALPITLTFQLPNGKTPVNVVVDPKKAEPGHRYWAIVVAVDGTSSVNSGTDTATLTQLFESSTRSIADTIQDGGDMAAIGWDTYNDNMRRLLNYQLLLASKVEDFNPALSYQIADFVMGICQGIPKAFDLYSQASAMVASKVVNQGNTMTSLVPKLDLSTAQQVLKSRLDSASAFDSAYRELQRQDVNSNNASLLASVTLDKS
ncbi:hypothetical protein FSARC_15032, partial [Fusarium sarcochroum]